MARFLDSPAELDKRIDRLLDHLRFARTRFDHTNVRGLPTPAQLVLILIKDAMYTHRMLPDLEHGRLSKIRTLMPQTRFSDRDVYDLELSRLLSGMSAFDPTRVRVSVSADDADAWSTCSISSASSPASRPSATRAWCWPLPPG